LPVALVPPIPFEAPSSGSPSAPPALPGTTSAFRFFSPTSFWNEPLAADAPLDPSSPELVEFFGAEITRELRAGTGPWINTTSDSVPLYTVQADQPTVPIQLAHQEEPALTSSWEAVPLPSTAQAAAGSDRYLAVWQPSADELWEFWRLSHNNGGWSASWGGSMRDVSSNPGVFGPDAWPGAQSWWGASATSLPLLGGLITLEDLQQGRIEHALAMSLPTVRAGVYATPAQREDGHSANPLSLPEGAHLRLDPALDLATLGLPPLTLMMAEAAQRYGIIVRDRSSNVAFFGQDPTPTGANPYTAPGGYFAGKYPSELLASFPWSDLQVLNMELHEG
jgi:hypothetical protein